MREGQSWRNANDLFAQKFKLTFVRCNGDHLPAYNDELALGGLWPDASPDVHGEQSAAAVEDGGQRRHEGSQHHSQHQTS